MVFLNPQTKIQLFLQNKELFENIYVNKLLHTVNVFIPNFYRLITNLVKIKKVRLSLLC